MAKQAKNKKQKNSQPKQHQPVKSYQPNFFDNIYNDYIEKYPFLVFLGLLISIATFVFWDFITLEKLFLFKDIGSDSMNTFLPTYIINAKALEEGLNYTFQIGLGNGVTGSRDILSSILLYATNPLWTLISDGGSDGVAYKIGFLIYTHLLIAGIIFYFFLRTFTLSKITGIVGGLLFAFSGFMMVGIGWYQHSIELVYVAFLLFSFEKLFQHKNYLLLPLAVAMYSKVGGAIYIFFHGLSLFIYSLFRVGSADDMNLKKFVIWELKFAALSILGLAINYGNLVNQIDIYTSSDRFSGNISNVEANVNAVSVPIYAHAWEYATGILRLFSSDLLGGGVIEPQVIQGKRYLIPEYKGWNNYYESPMFYIGLLPILIFSQIFSNINTRKKLIFISYIVFWLLPFIFPYIRKAYWAFTADYYRTMSFLIVFPILIIGIQAFDKIAKDGKINLIALIATLAGLLILLYYPYHSKEVMENYYRPENPINSGLRMLVTVLLFVFSALFLSLKYNPKYKNTVLIVIAFIVVFEAANMANRTINERSLISTEEYEGKNGFNDYTKEAVAYIDSIDKSFYRIEKEYASGPAVHGSLNDAQVQGYFGTARYASMQDPLYTRFLQSLEVIKAGDEMAARWSPGFRSRPLLQTFANVKYNLSKSAKPAYLQFGYKPIHKTGDVTILKNQFSLPLGFSYDTYIKESDFVKLSRLEKDITLLKAVVVKDDEIEKYKGLSEFVKSDTLKQYSWNKLKEDITALSADSLKLIEFRQDKFKAKISTTGDKLTFFTIPYSKNWQIIVDGEKREPLLSNIAFIGIMLNEGNHEIQFKFEPQIAKVSISSWIGYIFFVLYLLLVGKYFLDKRKQQDVTEL